MDREGISVGKTTYPAPLCVPQIPNELSREGSQVFRVTNRRLSGRVSPENCILSNTDVILKASRMCHVVHDGALLTPRHGIYILGNISLCGVHSSIECPQTHLQAFSSRLREVYSLK